MTDSDAQAARKAADLEEVLAGLALPQKRLSPKYFYDERGSKLFEAITEQPEYYPTRTEIGILEENIQAIGEAQGTGVSLIEFGAGASVKVRILLDHVPGIGVFVPVDVSGEHLQAAADTLALAYPNIEVLPVTADFTRPFQLPSPRVMPDRNIVFFPGSTIGNFPPEAAQELLTTMRRTAGDGGGLLIGVALKKDADVLERSGRRRGIDRRLCGSQGRALRRGRLWSGVRWRGRPPRSPARNAPFPRRSGRRPPRRAAAPRAAGP